MLKSMYSGVSGMKSFQTGLDVIGNNIANANTAGFKSARSIFKERLYQTTTQATGATNTLGGVNPSQIGYGSDVGSVDIMFTAQDGTSTGVASDCMIDGEGFFMVGQKYYDTAPTSAEEERETLYIKNSLTLGEDAGDFVAGIGALQLTRVGDFKIDEKGFLVDGNGNCVYGVNFAEYDDDGKATYNAEIWSQGDDGEVLTGLEPLCITTFEEGPDGENAPQKLSNIKIDQNGVVMGTDNTGSAVVIGKIAIAYVQNQNALSKEGGGYYKAGNNTGEVTGNLVGSGLVGVVQSGYLENSNVDLANEFANMIVAQRGFQANSRIISVSDSILEELVNLKR